MQKTIDSSPLLQGVHSCTFWCRYKYETMSIAHIFQLLLHERLNSEQKGKIVRSNETVGLQGTYSNSIKGLYVGSLRAARVM